MPLLPRACALLLALSVGVAQASSELGDGFNDCLPLELHRADSTHLVRDSLSPDHVAVADPEPAGLEHRPPWRRVAVLPGPDGRVAYDALAALGTEVTVVVDIIRDQDQQYRVRYALHDVKSQHKVFEADLPIHVSSMHTLSLEIAEQVYAALMAEVFSVPGEGPAHSIVTMSRTEAEKQAMLARRAEESRLAEEARMAAEAARQAAKRAEATRQRAIEEALIRAEAESAAIAEQQAREAAELAMLNAGTAKTHVVSVIDAMTTRITHEWRRPVETRSGLEVLLRIALEPGGELKSVRVVKGSGDEIFDRSGVNAVTRAAPFSEVRQLDRNIFEENFRTLIVRFKPED